MDCFFPRILDSTLSDILKGSLAHTTPLLFLLLDCSQRNPNRHCHHLQIQDTVTGFLLAGVGHRTAEGSNFLIVKNDTKVQQVEETFKKFSQRDDVGIILINQHIANDIRHVLKDYNATIPTVLEIPSKEHPYDPEQDYIMQRVNMFLGGGL